MTEFKRGQYVLDTSSKYKSVHKVLQDRGERVEVEYVGTYNGGKIQFDLRSNRAVTYRNKSDCETL